MWVEILERNNAYLTAGSLIFGSRMAKSNVVELRQSDTPRDGPKCWDGKGVALQILGPPGPICNSTKIKVGLYAYV